MNQIELSEEGIVIRDFQFATLREKPTIRQLPSVSGNYYAVFLSVIIDKSSPAERGHAESRH